jgi:hypothetical protein
MPHCSTCGVRLHRVHRTFAEKFRYMGVFRCPQCNKIEFMVRRYTYYFGEHARCPLCGTYRLRALAERDHIDRMLKTPMSAWHKMTGGRLCHCRYCRIQFYDKRPLTEETAAKGMAAECGTPGKG